MKKICDFNTLKQLHDVKLTFSMGIHTTALKINNVNLSQKATNWKVFWAIIFVSYQPS